MSPLNHNDDTDLHSPAPERTLRPVAVEQAEANAKPRVDHYAGNKKIAAAQKRLDALVAAEASGPVISRAQRALTEARLDHDENLTLARTAVRTKTMAEAKEQIRLQHEREVLFRISPLAPVIGIRFANLQISLAPERAMDPTVRSFAYADYHKALQIIQRETTQAAGIASRASAPLIVLPVDEVRLQRELEDLCRRSIHSGCLTIEVL